MFTGILEMALTNVVWAILLRAWILERSRRGDILKYAALSSLLMGMLKYAFHANVIAVSVANLAVGYALLWHRLKRVRLAALAQSALSHVIANGIYLAAAAISVSTLSLFKLSRNEWTVLAATLALFCAGAVSLYKLGPNTGLLSERVTCLLALLSWPVFLVLSAIFSTALGPGGGNSDGYSLLALLSTTFLTVATLVVHFSAQSELVSAHRRIRHLLRQAHRFKELIPAIEQELYRIRHTALQGENDKTVRRLDAAIKEIRALRSAAGFEAQMEGIVEQNFSTTGLEILDSQLISEQVRALQDGITFTVMVFAPVAGIVSEQVIEQRDLHILIGDLFRNAKAAVRLSQEETREILLSLGHTQLGYQIKCSDTGVPFPADVLNSLGSPRTENGRAQYGYLDIIQIVHKCNASIQVEEFQPGCKLFTKSVTVIFDGQSKLSVQSYRAEICSRVEDVKAATKKKEREVSRVRDH